MRKFIIALLLVLTLTSCVGEEPIETTEAPVTTAELTLMTEATLEPEPEPVLYKFSFIAAGDNMAYYGNIRDAKRNAEGTDMLYDFRPSYTSIKPLVEAHDLSFINQETLMCGEGFDLSYYPRFNSP